MKYAVLLVGVGLMFTTTASAQDEGSTAATAPTSAATETAAESAPKKEEEKRSIYSRKVRGLLWIEGLVGFASYDPDQFGSLDFTGGNVPNAPRLKGPEYGFAAGVSLGGFWLGGFYRQANFDEYKLAKIGLDIQGVFRFIPFVHPMVRLDMFYATIFDGNPYQLTGSNIDGGGFTLGAGLMVPIIRWISFTATFDWSFIGLAVRGTPAGSTTQQKAGISGQEVGITFALTFHFIGVRRGD